jgi:hypothetical protein
MAPSNVIAALMRNAAREAVKYNIWAEGLRVTNFLPKDITRMAEAFIDNHRDKLLAGALRAIERSPELQRLLEKEQREWAKRIAQAQGADAVSAALAQATWLLPGWATEPSRRASPRHGQCSELALTTNHRSNQMVEAKSYLIANELRRNEPPHEPKGWQRKPSGDGNEPELIRDIWRQWLLP